MDSHAEQQEETSQRFIKLVQADEQITATKHVYSTFSTREILVPSIGKIYLFGMKMKDSGDMKEPSSPAILLGCENVTFGKSGQFDREYYLTNVHMNLPSRPSIPLKAIMRHPKLEDQFTTQFDFEHPERENTHQLEAIPVNGVDWINLKTGIKFAIYTSPKTQTLEKFEFAFIAN